MKGFFSLFILFSATLAITYAGIIRTLPRLDPNHPEVPVLSSETSPIKPVLGGTGPFNPKPEPLVPRLRRSPEDDKNKITVNADKEGGKSSYNVEYERKIYENKYGSIGANVGVNKNPGQKPESQVGISGSFHW